MKITLIITRRTDKQAPKRLDINALIKSVFSKDVEAGIVQFVEGRKLLVKGKSKYVPIEYSFVKTKKVHILDVSTKDETVDSFIAMEYFLKQFTINAHKEDFNIIKAFDEPSQVLCSRLYKPLTKFERSLRKLVYEIVVKAYGSAWYKNTIEDLTNNCKALKEVYEKVSISADQNHINKIECALEELDYASLCKYLFSKASPMSYSEVLEKELSDEKLSEMTKDDMVKIIHDSRPRSLWERLFHDFTELSDLEREIPDIHSLRNKVMHAKSVTYDEYQTLKKLLVKWNTLIEKAIEQTEVNDYSEIQNISIIQSLSELGELITAITRPISESLINSAQLMTETVVKAVEATVSPIMNLDWSSFTRNLISLSGLVLSEPENEQAINESDNEKQNDGCNDAEDNNDDKPE